MQINHGGNNTDAWFAVFDGHGPSGTECARFARNKLPTLLATHVRDAQLQKRCCKSPSGTTPDATSETMTASTTTAASDPHHVPHLTPQEYEDCLRRSYLETNALMHRSIVVDDAWSGTTAVSISFHGSFVTIANCGDSRAILGRRRQIPEQPNNSPPTEANGSDTAPQSADEKPANPPTVVANSDCDDDCEIDCDAVVNVRPNAQLVAIPLSRDQTPYRKDERERVTKAGAAVLSIDQIEGRETLHDDWMDGQGEDVDIQGDPPRLWVKGQEYPGTAFTRSIGDAVAETIGVIAEPEMLSLELTADDQILVIASDGVFEFLSNQQVIDLCVEAGNPLKACEAVVQAAYQQWLLYESRTDDITAIVCFLKCDRPSRGEENGTSESLLGKAESSIKDDPLKNDDSLVGREERYARGFSMVSAPNGVPPAAFAQALSQLNPEDFSSSTIEEVTVEEGSC